MATLSQASPRSSHSLQRRLHRMYSRGQKKKVAYYARHHGIRAAARRYGVHHRNVEHWLAEQMDEITNPGIKKKNRKGQGRKISYPQELDEQLAAWILEKREEAFIPVSYQMIHLKALSFIRPINPQFKASDGWLKKFLVKHNLVLRARTSISQTLPKDLESKIAAFHHEVRGIRVNSDFPYELIANMDETPVFLDLVPRRTVDKKGKSQLE